MTLRIRPYAVTLLAMGCTAEISSTDVGYPNLPTFEGELPSCPGQDFIDDCSGEVARIQITVHDQNGLPLNDVLIAPYTNSTGGSRSEMDPTRFPEKDSAGRELTYHTCTNNEGEAWLCGFEETWSLLGLVALKSGYTPDYRPKMSGTTTPLSLELMLEEIPEQQEDQARILVMTCELPARAVRQLVEKHVRFTLAFPFAAIDQLTGPDCACPGDLDDGSDLSQCTPGCDCPSNFDTFLIDFTCSQNDVFFELLVPEKRERLFSWIRAGNRLIFTQQQDNLWTSDAENGARFGCDANQLLNGCPKDLFPMDYRYDLLYERAGGSGGCNDFSSAIAQPSPAGDFMRYDGINWTDWSYTEEFKYDPAISTLGDNTSVFFDGIDGASIDGTPWTPLLVGPTTSSTAEEQEHTKKQERGCIDAPDPERSIGAMQTRMGCGAILVDHTAWHQGSAPEFVGLQPVDEAKRARDRFIEYVCRCSRTR